MAAGALFAGLLFSLPAFALPSSSEDEDEEDDEEEEEEEELSLSLSLLLPLLLPLLLLLLLLLLSCFFSGCFVLSSRLSFLGGLLFLSWFSLVSGLLPPSAGLGPSRRLSVDGRRASSLFLPCARSPSWSLCLFGGRSFSLALSLSLSRLLSSSLSLWRPLGTGEREAGDGELRDGCPPPLESFFCWHGDASLSGLLPVSLLLSLSFLSVRRSLSPLLSVLTLSFSDGGEGEEESCLAFLSSLLLSLSRSLSLLFSLLVSCLGGGGGGEGDEEESCLVL